MIERTLSQALNLAGIYDQDSDLERDLKFECWINQRKYKIIAVDRYVQEREHCRENGVEVLIIKE